MSKPDYDTTLARMAGNIAGSICDGYDGREELHAEVIAATAVRIARAIVEEVKRTQPVNPQNLEQK